MPVQYVLIVDDSKSARLMLRKMLQGFGMTVDTVESGEEALNYLRDRQPDAIFMDHTMPGMDGLMVVRQIKDSPATAAIPVTMYTSKDEPSYQDEARAAGAVGVLSKPALPETLTTVLEQLNRLFDAANNASKSNSSASDAAAAGAVSADWVGVIALEKAEQVFYDAIEAQVLPLINDVVAKLRRDLEANQQEVCERIATRVCKEHLAAWQPPEPREVQVNEMALREQVLPLMEQQLEIQQRAAQADLEKTIREVAGQVCQRQLHELSNRMIQQLSQRFSDAVYKAGETAREAAVSAAQEVALQAADKSAADQAEATMTAEQTMRQLLANTQRDLRRYVYLAAVAAVVGIGAAVLAYVLR